MEQFPPNSHKAERRGQDKQIKQITSADAVRRKKPLGKQFSQTFIGGDAKTAMQYMLFNVLVPAAKEALVEAASSGFEKLIYGETRPKRGRPGMGGPSSGPLGYVSYNRGPEDTRSPQPKMLSKRSRTRHDFDDIVINSRQEAEEVIDRLFDLISKYDTATVADLYELTGLESSHTDHKWGWGDLRGATIGRVRGGGYLLNLPEPGYFE
jgi:hypothetical protein